MNLWDKVDRLAASIAEAAMNAGPDARLDALKALTAYRVAAGKSPAPPGDDPAKDQSGRVIDFAEMARRIAASGEDQA